MHLTARKLENYEDEAEIVSVTFNLVHELIMVFLLTVT